MPRFPQCYTVVFKGDPEGNRVLNGEPPVGEPIAVIAGNLEADLRDAKKMIEATERARVHWASTANDRYAELRDAETRLADCRRKLRDAEAQIAELQAARLDPSNSSAATGGSHV